MEPPYHRLVEFVPLGAPDFDFLRQATAPLHAYRRGQIIRAEGEDVAGVYFLHDGWVTSSVMLRDGRRQIVKVHIRGDMLGFPSLALAQAGETLEALSDVAVAHIPNAAIGAMFEEAPHVAAAMFLSSQRERVALMHSLSWLGATSAFERLVAFIIDLHHRLNAAGLVSNSAFAFPLRQQHIAELLGITAVHTNRVLRRLDHSGYVERSRETITITDLQGLQSLAANRMPASGGTKAWFRLKPA